MLLRVERTCGCGTRATCPLSGQGINALGIRFIKHLKPVTPLACREFQAALIAQRTYKQQSLFLQRIFTLLDANGDGLISFDDFLMGIARLAPNAVPGDKMRCAWV